MSCGYNTWIEYKINLKKINITDVHFNLNLP